MSDNIYIWEGGNGNVAHASMTLYGGTHISWWPKEDKSKSPAKHLMISVTDAGPADSYSDDSEWKGKAADHTIPIRGRVLDMVAIKIWWRNFKDRAKNVDLDTNGCTVIYEALRAGGAANYVDIPHNPLGTPASLKTYALKLKRSMEGP